nr:DapH/DapD/GlmU-related protein [Gordonia sp. LAM0048]
MSPTFEFDNAPIEIRDRAWVGARAVILRGVVLNERSVVGANAVVHKDVEAGAVVIASSRQVDVTGDE